MAGSCIWNGLVEYVNIKLNTAISESLKDFHRLPFRRPRLLLKFLAGGDKSNFCNVLGCFSVPATVAPSKLLQCGVHARTAYSFPLVGEEQSRSLLTAWLDMEAPLKERCVLMWGGGGEPKCLREGQK